MQSQNELSQKAAVMGLMSGGIMRRIMAKMDIARRLREVQGDRTDRECAEFVGKATNTYNGWKLGKREPGAEELSRLADLFGVGIGYFYEPYEDDDLERPATRMESPQAPAYRAAPQELMAQPEFVSVPNYDVAASAGDGAWNSQENIKGHLQFSRTWLKSVTTATPDKLMVITVRGDSMAPTLGDGDHVLVDTSRKTPTRDGIYILEFSGELLVKRATVDPIRGEVTITSDNATHQPKVFPANQVRVVGRVIWLGRKV